mmetsp:Transcript_11678/g.27976  ORF Transcript_11678/g.27976 Transcript_11678/m.27976 type:complete len:172 (+) Transcript_11678:185-700(+)
MILTMNACLSILFLLVVSFAGNNSEPKPFFIGAEEAEREEVRTLMGGYQELADPMDVPFIRESADLVLETLKDKQPYGFASTAASYRIIQAEQQVVAGLNYKLTMIFGDRPIDSNGDGDDGDEEKKEGNCVGGCRVVVYNHFGDLSITEWSKELTCEEVLAMEDEQAGDEN